MTITQNYIARTIVAFLCSVFLSPGMLVGHGILPFPAGLAIFVYMYDHSLGLFNLGFNAVCWITTLAGFMAIAYKLPARAKVAENSEIDQTGASRAEENKELEVAQGGTSLSSQSKPKKFVASFTSATRDGTSYHHAIVDEGDEGLMLSVYEGESNDALALVQTYLAANWDELSSCLNSKTSFRRGDFRV